ncbi:MAG TPA: hypothetical protein VGB85_17060, partial [Nannocystis sp.]
MAVVPGPRRRVLAWAALWVGVVIASGCPGRPEVVGTPPAAKQSAAGSMVPAATHEAKLPAAHVATPEPTTDPPRDPPPDPTTPAVAPGAGDPRAVPPGTPPAIARVFQRLPVAIHDGPPLGGIGAT